MRPPEVDNRCIIEGRQTLAPVFYNAGAPDFHAKALDFGLGPRCHQRFNQTLPHAQVDELDV
jgi:hypothetical protein